MRFDVIHQGNPLPCFAVRFDGRAHAFVNSCPHRRSELDWQHGEFFDESGLYLICATHGAAFDPATGICVSGPCAGERLFRVSIREEDGRIALEPDTGTAESS